VINRTITAALAMVCLFGISGTAAQAQTVDLFRNDPVKFFSSEKTCSWVGSGTYFQNNYSDTLRFAPDSSGRGLEIRRVLVNADKGQAISRGFGYLSRDPGDSTFTLRWDERGYESVSGRMRWRDGQWIVGFSGEWSQWSINVRQDSTWSLVAAAARMIPGFRPVELAEMTYRAISN
jgi:hypothetical protein